MKRCRKRGEWPWLPRFDIELDFREGKLGEAARDAAENLDRRVPIGPDLCPIIRSIRRTPMKLSIPLRPLGMLLGLCVGFDTRLPNERGRCGGAAAG